MVATVLLGYACAPVNRVWRSTSTDGATVDSATDFGAAPVTRGATPEWIDPLGPVASGCVEPTETERLLSAWDFVRQHTVAAPEALLDCLRQHRFSPATNGFAEELLARLQAALPSRLGCEPRAASLNAHDQARLSERALYVGRDLLATRSTPRVGDAIVHAILHSQGFDHHSGERGEYHHSAFSLLDRCLRQVVDEQGLSELPRIQPRDRMAIESELQPFGQMGGTQLPFFHLECPPGSLVTGHGVAHDAVESPPRVRAYGLICSAQSAVEAARPSVGTPERWASCGPDEVVVGVQGVASNGYIFSVSPLCGSRSAPGQHPPRPLEALPVSEGAGGRRIERRCPPGQAVFALEGIASGDVVRQMAFACRDPGQVRVGSYRELEALGMPPTGLGARVGLGRCSDQGAMVGFFGHVRPSARDVLRLGGVCRGTAWVGDRFGFREQDGELVPEHVVPAVGGVPSGSSPDAPSFAELATHESDGRCPRGMALVGVRVQREDDRTLRSLQGLCVALDDWVHARPTPIRPVTILGVWEQRSAPEADDRVCGQGELLAGLRVERAPLVGRIIEDRVERFAPICRSFRVVR